MRTRASLYRSLGRVFLVLISLMSLPATAKADAVLDWNEIAARTVTTQNPFNQARVMAIVQLSVFEAVNAITGDYEPYLAPPTAAPAGASVDAAVIIAAHKVADELLSSRNRGARHRP